MHNAAFVASQLDWRYVPLPVDVSPPERIGDAIRGLHALGLRGANVTVPHKQSVMQHLHRMTSAANAIGAVNTISVQGDGVLVGDNTDARGFVADLKDHRFDPLGRAILVLGAGGSSRAVVYGLAQAGSSAIMIANRTFAKAEQLASDMQHLFPDCTLSAHLLPQDLAKLTDQADLVVNCTSLGMYPNGDGTPWDNSIRFHLGQTVYDLVYNPQETRLIQRAVSDGATGIGGLGMLIWQGAIAFELWTGKPAPIAAMKRAASAALGRR
jgi:shikimate dehydrogenase